MISVIPVIPLIRLAPKESASFSNVAIRTVRSFSFGCHGTPLVRRGSAAAGRERFRRRPLPTAGTRLLLREPHLEFAGVVYRDAGFDADLTTLLLLDPVGDMDTLQVMLPGSAAAA